MPFDKVALINRLQRGSARARVAFAGSCCNRVVDSYRAFSAEAKWGDPEALVDAIEFLWESLEEGNEFPLERLEQLIAECQEATPDLDDIDANLATWGHDAALVVLCALQCALDGTAESAAEAASWSHATVDAFVQVAEDMDPSDPNLDRASTSIH